MSNSSPLDAKEQIKQAIDIVELIGSQISLRRQGRTYVGLCPWHDDSRPSLQVNPERQSFKCWVCDIGGDIFSFVMKMEGVDFREAVAMLADRAGITLQAGRKQQPPPGSPGDKRTLYQALAWSTQQYHRCLLESPEAEPARRYLQQRGITPESIKNFQLGYASEQRDWILHQALGSPFKSPILEAVGILARPASGTGLYDRFRGRVLFSIRDVQGRPVGLGGRILPESGSTSPAKYINSPETPLFAKSKLLYGLDLARDAIRKARTALIMEGYTDVIVAHQYGFNEAVAVLGTAVGEPHIRTLKHFADRIVMVLDGDAAGQRRTNEVLELFIAQQVDLRVLTLPEGLDPCDFLHERGAAAFRELLDNEAIDALEHAFRTATRGLDLERDVHGASEAMERLVSIVAKAPRLRDDTTQESRLREEKILARIAARFRVDEHQVRERLTALRRRAQSHPAPVRTPAGQPPQGAGMTPGKIEPHERELLELMISFPECLPTIRPRLAPGYFAAPIGRRVYEACCQLADAGTVPTFDRLMLEFDDPATKSLLVSLDEQAHAKGSRPADPQMLFEQLLKTFEQKESERQRPKQIVALREGGLDDSQGTAMLEEIFRQERNRQGIPRPTDG